MRNTTRFLVGAGALAVGSLAMAAPALAGTITTPSSNPYTATGYTSADASGQPTPWTVSGSGFPANTQIFAEFCDGVASTTPGYDPASHCDLGSSGAAAISDGSGNVTFSATDANHHILPFLGDSPQGIFACIYPNQQVNDNGYTGTAGTAYTNCQLRLSTNNTAVTSDQAYQTVNYVNPGSGTNAPASTVYGSFGAVGGGAVLLGAGLFLARKRRSATAAV